MRALSAKMKTALRERVISPVVLAKIGHPDGAEYYWSGVGTLDWDGQQWTGAGALGSIGGVEQTGSPEISEISFSMAGVNEEAARWLREDIKGQVAQVWWGLLDDQGQVIDAIEEARVVLDTSGAETSDDGTTTLTLVGQGSFFNIDLPAATKWTAEEQKAIYPNDTGFDLIPGLADLSVQWAAP